MALLSDVLGSIGVNLVGIGSAVFALMRNIIPSIIANIIRIKAGS
jgi:hypothetical protein